jgi:hypothetical protein
MYRKTEGVCSKLNGEQVNKVKLPLCLIKHHALKTWVVKLQLHTFLTLALDVEQINKEEKGPGTEWEADSLFLGQCLK